MKKTLLAFIVLALVVVIYSWGLWNTYFQQDEWNGFGLILQLQGQPISRWFSLITSQHAVPMTLFVWSILYRLFGYQASYYALYSLALHITATFLVCYFVTKLAESRPVGFLTALLFATNIRAAQAYHHLAVFSPTLSSFILSLTFFICLAAWRKSGLNIRKIALLIALFYLSVFFREDGVILPVLLPVFMWLYYKRPFSRSNLRHLAVFYIGAGGYAVYRVLQQLSNSVAMPVVGGGFTKIFLYNAVSLPFKLVVQNFVEGIHLYNFFWKYKHIVYPDTFGQITVGLMYTVVYDFLILIVFTAGVFVLWAITKNEKNLSYRRFSIFSVAWITAASLLLAAVGRPHNIVESRYLYLTSLPVIGTAVFAFVLFFRSFGTYGIITVTKRILLAACLAAYLWASYTQTRQIIKGYQYQSDARQRILRDLTRLYPVIPKKTVFFVRCAERCVYNLDRFGAPNEYVLPFTSGPGWIFMLQYAQGNDKEWAPFFSRMNGKEFLWDLGAEGYRHIGNRGFGYFISRDKLLETLEAERLGPDAVIALAYDESQYRLIDVSSDVRSELHRLLRGN